MAERTADLRSKQQQLAVIEQVTSSCLSPSTHTLHLRRQVLANCTEMFVKSACTLTCALACEQENAEMRAKIAAQTVSRDDVIRMNHERCGSLHPSVQNPSCPHLDQRLDQSALLTHNTSQTFARSLFGAVHALHHHVEWALRWGCLWRRS